MTSLRLTLVALCLLVALTAANPLETNLQCVKNSRPCVHASECCGGCCVESTCVEHADSCIQAASPCATHACPQGQKCYLSPVQCIQAPCPPIPACKGSDYDDYN